MLTAMGLTGEGQTRYHLTMVAHWALCKKQAISWKVTMTVNNLVNIVWVCPILPSTNADGKIWDKGCFMEVEVGKHDDAYKGRSHSHVLFIGRKTLTVRQKTYNNIHGWNIGLPTFGLGGLCVTCGWVP